MADSFLPLKLLTSFATPLGFALLLGIVGLIWPRRMLLGMALVWLWFWSMPWTADFLAHRLEGEYPLKPAVEAPTADVIVVLGGALFTGSKYWQPEHNLSAAGDRIRHAGKLYRLGKAPQILYSGGPKDDEGNSEARAGTELLGDLGVPANRITQEPDSRTTRENAAFSMPLLKKMGAQRALLVTSRWHMKRSLKNYQAAAAREGLNIEFIPAPCDPVQLSDTYTPWMWFVPSTDALDASRRLVKEYLGLAHARVLESN